MISVRVVDSADARKLAETILAIAGHKIWGALDSVDVQAIVIGASNDTLHDHDDALRISALIEEKLKELIGKTGS